MAYTYIYIYIYTRTHTRAHREGVRGRNNGLCGNDMHDIYTSQDVKDI